MPRTQINCPNCKQPIIADVQQLFDVAQDPEAKSRLLSGMSNFIQCQVCGYQGNLATPIVYHDPD
ncbi:MAG: CpXC domain-containing protein, partial [Anaerolineales bacterium]